MDLAGEQTRAGANAPLHTLRLNIISRSRTLPFQHDSRGFMDIL